jgi:hypothetical protein
MIFTRNWSLVTDAWAARHHQQIDILRRRGVATDLIFFLSNDLYNHYEKRRCGSILLFLLLRRIETPRRGISAPERSVKIDEYGVRKRLSKRQSHETKSIHPGRVVGGDRNYRHIDRLVAARDSSGA